MKELLFLNLNFTKFDQPPVDTNALYLNRMVDYIPLTASPINHKLLATRPPLSNVNRALFVTVFETLSVYMHLTKNSRNGVFFGEILGKRPSDPF